jgi:hypothetical protein
MQQDGNNNADAKYAPHRERGIGIAGFCFYFKIH